MTITKGKEMEDLACQYLTTRGLRLLTRNFYCRLGEIDLVMRDDNMIIFVEVRFRRNAAYGSSAESVTVSKQTKLIKTATYYLQMNRLIESSSCRFDVIAIMLKNNKPEIEWIKNAFQVA